MRPLFAIPLMTLAVLLSTSRAQAQDVGRCIDRPMVVESASIASHSLSDPDKSPNKVTDEIASLVHTDPVVTRPRGPRQNQSRAPVTCSDPSQPGCHVDRQDTPPHSTWNAVSGAGGDASVPTLAVGPPGQTVYVWPCPVDGVLPAGHLRLPWRPPAA